METINLQGLIDKKGLDKNMLAAGLFPHHKYPKLALSRVLSGEGVLDADQISRLAAWVNEPISNLYSGGWSNIPEGKNILTFSNGDFTAKLDRDTWTTRVFHNNKILHEFLLHSNTVTLKEYISKLDSLIK